MRRETGDAGARDKGGWVAVREGDMKGRTGGRCVHFLRSHPRSSTTWPLPPRASGVTTTVEDVQEKVLRVSHRPSHERPQYPSLSLWSTYHSCKLLANACFLTLLRPPQASRRSHSITAATFSGCPIRKHPHSGPVESLADHLSSQSNLPREAYSRLTSHGLLTLAVCPRQDSPGGPRTRERPQGAAHAPRSLS